MAVVPAVPLLAASSALSTGTEADDPHSVQACVGYLGWRNETRASLNNEHCCGIGIHGGVNMLQKKKSYCDDLESGMSPNLKNESYKKDSITGCDTLAWWKVYLTVVQHTTLYLWNLC